MVDATACPACGQAIKGGLFSNKINTADTQFINEALGTSVPAHCDICVGPQLYKARPAWRQTAPVTDAAEDVLLSRLQRYLSEVPLLSIPHPAGWECEPIALVTAQSVAGTGLFADVGATLTDMFGLQSGKFRDKLKGGEDRCKAALRMDAVKLGGHAVIGIDVDYAEVGGSRCMLMVCMTGTAVRLANLDAVAPHVREASTQALEIFEELDRRRAPPRPLVRSEFRCAAALA